MDLGLSADKTVAARAEASWRAALKIPDDPPWVYCKQAAALEERPRVGIVRRPLIWPPPRHIPTSPAEMEVAELEPGGVEWRKRLEDRARDDIHVRREGNVVYDDTLPYGGISGIRQRGGSDESPLVFESRFESGNLRKATQVGMREYELTLRPDKDSGHVQWYYFMVSNVKAGVPYIFSITNFVKQRSLYNQGLKPLLYSSMDAANKKKGWRRTGTKCAYLAKGGRHTLTFTVEFPNDGDVCYLAHCYPYTYTDIQLFLASLEADPKRKATFQKSELCRSLADNKVDLLTITEPGELPENVPPKGSILLTARVHPGESQASWSMQGCIEFLTSDADEARLLRQRYVIYVVPMLNPDGVINGHYRCSLAGQDLNRLWAEPDLGRHPCIWHVKNLVRSLSQKGLVFFCDFHGHSTKKNAFMYGCDRAANIEPKAGQPPGGCTAFPQTLSEISAAFSFHDCDFKIQKNKVTTGRVVVCREFGISNSYTLEVSFLGHKVGTSLIHFNLSDLQQLGRHFGMALVKHHLPAGFAMLTSKVTDIPDTFAAEMISKPAHPPQVTVLAASKASKPVVMVDRVSEVKESDLMMHSPVDKVWQEFLESPDRKQVPQEHGAEGQVKCFDNSKIGKEQELPLPDAGAVQVTQSDTLGQAEETTDLQPRTTTDAKTGHLAQTFIKGIESDSPGSSDKLDSESGTASTICALENECERTEPSEKAKSESPPSEGDGVSPSGNANEAEDDCSSSDHASETEEKTENPGPEKETDKVVPTVYPQGGPYRFEPRRRSSVNTKELREVIAQAFGAHLHNSVRYDHSFKSNKLEDNGIHRSKSSEYARKKKIETLQGLLKTTNWADPQGIADEETAMSASSEISFSRAYSSEGLPPKRRDSLVGTEISGRHSRLHLGRSLSVRHEKELTHGSGLEIATDAKSALLKSGHSHANGVIGNQEYIPINCSPSAARRLETSTMQGNAPSTPPNVKTHAHAHARRSFKNRKDYSFANRPPPQTAGPLSSTRHFSKSESSSEGSKSLAVVSGTSGSTHTSSYWWDNVASSQRLDRSMKIDNLRTAGGGGSAQVAAGILGTRKSPGFQPDKLSLPSILGNREGSEFQAFEGSEPFDAQRATSAAAKLMAIPPQPARTSSRENLIVTRKSRPLEPANTEVESVEPGERRTDAKEASAAMVTATGRRVEPKFIRNIGHFKQGQPYNSGRRPPSENIALPKPTIIFDS